MFVLAILLFGFLAAFRIQPATWHYKVTLTLKSWLSFGVSIWSKCEERKPYLMHIKLISAAYNSLHAYIDVHTYMYCMHRTVNQRHRLWVGDRDWEASNASKMIIGGAWMNRWSKRLTDKGMVFQTTGHKQEKMHGPLVRTVWGI